MRMKYFNMSHQDFIAESAEVKSKQEAVALIAEFTTSTVSPTFGLTDDEGRKVDPYCAYNSETDEEEEHECVDTWKKSLILVDILAKKWEVAFDPDLFEATMSAMRNNYGGLWNSSSIGC